MPQINSLQDLLLLQQVQQQADPVYSALQSLSNGVAQRIDQAKQDKIDQKKQEDGVANIYKTIQRLDPTNSKKIQASLDSKGNTSFQILKTQAPSVIGEAPKGYVRNPNYGIGSNEPYVKSDADIKNANHQDMLENQYSNRLKTMFSNRSGVLGVAAQKTDSAIQLRTLVNTSYDPATGNYNLTNQQYHELALGLASLLAPNAVASDAKMQSLIARSAEGDSLGLLQYITGTPQNGTSQQLFKNIVGTIDREGLQAEKSRNTHLETLKDLIPSGLEASRADALKKVTFGTNYSDFLKESPDYKQYKSGETRNINGVTYQRDENGQWHPQS